MSGFRGNNTKHRIMADYNSRVATEVARGRYVHVTADINDANFPLNKEGGVGCLELSVWLKHYGETTDTRGVLWHLARLGLQPATMAELLGFGAAIARSAEPLPYDVVALGSRYGESDMSDYMVGVIRPVEDGRRRLDLMPYNTPWGPETRFLATELAG